MRHRKVLAVIAGGGAVALSLGLAQPAAFADAGLAPGTNDVVGVGSDTVQYAIDFLADGDYVFDSGYNSGGNVDRLVDFDATPDWNARLAYGSGGVGTGTCAPGTGTTKGTGNMTTTHTDKPCTLNPTIEVREQKYPMQRPNGSGAGAAALAADTHHFLDFSRASACQGPTTGCGGKLTSAYDSVQLGTDPLRILTATTTNAVALSSAQLNTIYSCTASPSVSGSTTTWKDVGGTSTDAIIPIIPQVGSGTRSSFLSNIGNPTLGSCVQTAEENDPTAIAAQSNPADAIEPMSGGRLNMFLGLNGSGAPVGGTGTTTPGFFTDPTCAFEQSSAAPTGGEACTAYPAPSISPAVKLWTTGTPSSGSLFGVDRPLYVYFRDADVNATSAWQPGSTLNKIRTLFYNPCPSGATNCVTDPTTGNIYGPGGAPYIATAAGQALISAAGITPTYVATVGGP